MFNNTDVGVIEGEPTQMVLLKEALEARVAAYKEAIEEAVKAAYAPLSRLLLSPLSGFIATGSPGPSGSPGGASATAFAAIFTAASTTTSTASSIVSLYAAARAFKASFSRIILNY